jgi:hypothetical protein
MSEPEERDRPNSGAVEDRQDGSVAESGAAVGSGHNLETSDRSDAGIGLTVGEPNTFEPEEAGPAVGSGPTE